MQRPPTITVFGILNIVFGVLGFCGVFFSLNMFLTEDDGTNPLIPIMQQSSLYKGFMIASIPLGLLVTVALLAAGIALLRDLAWGHKLSIIYAWYAIVSTIIGVIINAVVLVPPAMEQASGDMTPEAVGLIGGAIAGTCGAFIGLIYPVLLLFFMKRPNVKAWFDPTQRRALRDDAMAIEPWDA